MPRRRELLYGMGPLARAILDTLGTAHEPLACRDLIEDEGGWAPYVSPHDARKLDEARLAPRSGDLGKAAEFGRVFEPRPITRSSEAAAE